MSEADLNELTLSAFEKPSGDGLTLSQSFALEFRIIGSTDSHYPSEDDGMIWEFELNM